MAVAQPDRAQKHQRTLKRRAARTRRSKWLGKLLFSLTGMGILLVFRLTPELPEKVAIFIHDMQKGKSAPAAPPDQTQAQVRFMPADKVPVRRGGISTDPLN